MRPVFDQINILLSTTHHAKLLSDPTLAAITNR